MFLHRAKKVVLHTNRVNPVFGLTSPVQIFFTCLVSSVNMPKDSFRMESNGLCFILYFIVFFLIEVKVMEIMLPLKTGTFIKKK